MATEKRLIDANALRKSMCYKCNDEYSDEPCEPSDCVFYNAIKEAPTVDAVEVIRCKDCKHWKPGDSKGGNSIEDLQWIGGCKWAKCCRREMDFCSYGERKDND